MEATATNLAAEVAAHEWYHTLELAPRVVTPGWLDTRGIVEKIPFPDDLTGKRCLDIGTFDGFWAFEMERRGADEILGIDVLDPYGWDWPAGSDEETIRIMDRRKAGGSGFDLAVKQFGSKVTRRELSVLDLDPADVGQFDLVYLGSLLVHLRDPVTALERVRSVCRGSLIVVDGVDPLLSALFRRFPIAQLDGRGRPWWWYPNTAGMVRIIETAGFDLEVGPTRLYIPPGEGRKMSRRIRPSLLRSSEGRMALTVAWRGDPHAAVRCRPRPGLS